MSDSAGVYRFGDFEMEPGIAQLRQADSPVHVEPRTFDLLLYLVEHRSRFVEKAELLDVVWEGAFVTESALTRAVTRLRQVLGDSAHESRYVETLRGRGYRFSASIEIVSGGPMSTRRSPSAGAAAADRHPIGTGRHNIAPAARDFTGRASELAMLFAAIDNAAAVPIAGLRGMGGIGKSELARQVARARWNVYPDAHLEIDLGGASPEPISSATAIAQMLRDLNPQIELPDDPTLLRRLYRSSLSGQRGIVLLDNAASAEQVLPLLPPDGWLTLITSRFRFMVPGLDLLDLGPLPEEEARTFLGKLSPRSVPVVDDLLNLTGRLPLALRLSGSALAAHTDLPPAVFVRRLSVAGGLDDGVAASLSVSLDLLGRARQSRWTELAVFPGSFTAAAVAAVWQLDEEAAQMELSELFVASLVEWAGGRYRLHDLARVFAKGRLTDPEASNLRHAAYFVEELARFEARYLGGGEGVRDALACFDQERRNLEAARGSCLAGGHGESARELLARFPIVGDRLLAIRLFPDQDFGWRTDARQAARELGRRELEGELERGLGDACCRIGDSARALEHYAEALTRFRELADRRGESRALANLGHVQSFRGQLDEGLVNMERSLVMARELGDRRFEGHLLRLLGYCHQGLGESSKAIERYQEAVAIAREAGDWNGEGLALRQLGDTYADLGDAPKAIDCGEQALAIARDMNARRSQSDALALLGRGYADLGDQAKAVECCEESLTTAREVNNRPCQHTVLLTLGRGYADLGDVPKAIERYEESRTIAREIRHRGGEGVALRYLGSACAAQGDVSRAIECCEQALGIAGEANDRRGKSSALLNLGRAFADLGDEPKAADCFRQAILDARAVGNRRGEAFASWGLSKLLEQQGRLEQAVEQAGILVAYFHKIGHPEAETVAARVDTLSTLGATSDLISGPT